MSQPDDSVAIPFAPAAATWALGWVAGSVVLGTVLVAAMGSPTGDELSIAQLFVVVMGSWLVFLVALSIVSRKFGSGVWIADFGARFRPVDLVGIPVGILTQLVLIPVLYVPLRGLWPDTFSQQRVEERAQDLADRAHGFSAVLLVLIVVVGAPIVEELVYRGMLQRSLATAIEAAPALLVTAAWFSLIHLSPVEYPGLFLAGLVFGAAVLATNRIGPAIVTHAAFNATGIIMVLSNR